MFTLVALCPIGAEKITANEIKQLGYSPISNAPGRVVYSSNTEDSLYRSNLCLRTADRIYLQLTSFEAEDFDALFEGVKAVNWQDYFRKDVRVIVDKVRSHKSKLSSEHSIQSIVHKAIYSKLGEKWGISVLPESGSEATVRVYIEKNQAQLLLDLSGMPLHKRGYRTASVEAPIRETLAAVLLQSLLWRRKTPIHDLFCGSGTIPIEATLYAYNVAPGFGRRFALEELTIFDYKRDQKIRLAEAEKIRPDCVARITGSDISAEAVEKAKLNAEHACVMAGRALQSIGSDARIQRPDFIVSDFASLAAPYDQGLIIGNPPYGERLGNNAQAEELYTSMKSLFSSFPAWQMGFITSNPNFEKCMGRRATKSKAYKSGNLDTIFYTYEK